MEPLDPMTLDPGVRRLVMWLRSLGFNTTDSGDGVSKPADQEEVLEMPHVHIVVPDLDTDTLGREARRLYLEVRDAVSEVGPGTIQATYDPADGSCVVSLYGITDDMLPYDVLAEQDAVLRALETE